MAEITLYVLVDSHDVPGITNYENFEEAKREAQKYGMAVVAHVYEWADSELTWTPNGEDTWPPEKED